MTAQITLPEQRIELSGISWQTYETLLNELRARCLRMTYNPGYLEIMASSPEHVATGLGAKFSKIGNKKCMNSY